MKLESSNNAKVQDASVPGNAVLLDEQEIEQVSGGMNDWTAGGIAVIGLGIAGGVATGGFGLGIGLAMLYLGYQSGGGSGTKTHSMYSSH